MARRERVLGAAGAQDLEAYTALRATDPDLPPVPRLVLVVDEFRVLADELPDFVPGLVRLAAVGRSLGVHLVLATQRPSGVVSPEIKANVNLRVALRVQEPAESLDVVDVAGAAALPASTPGRALLRSGSEPPVLLQTARVAGSAAAGPSDVAVLPLRWRALGDPQPRPGAAGGEGGPTDLSALVDALRAAAEQEGIAPPASPWLPPLPASVLLDDLPVSAPGEGLTLPYGLLDQPARQRQVTATWDLAAHGPLAVVGGTRSGRTTLLRALLASLVRAGGAWAYVLDGGAGLRAAGELPQVGAVAERDDTERTLRVLDLLRDLVDRRQQGGPPGNEPWVVLVVDGWDAVQAACEDAGALRAGDALLHVLRQGPAVRVLTVLSGGRQLLAGQVGSALPHRLVLRTADSGDAVMAGVPGRAVPASWATGRALRVGDDGVEQVQVALLAPDPGAPAQAAALAAAAAPAAAPATPPAPPVPAMPAQVALEQVLAAVPGSVAGSGWLPLGVGGPRVTPQGWDPARQGPVLLVGGHPGSGRSTTLLTLAHVAAASGRSVVPVAARRSPLQRLAGALGPDDPDGLRAALGRACADRRPVLVLVDDVEAFDGSASEPVLADLVESLLGGPGERTPGDALAASGATTDLLTRYTGVVPRLRRPGVGLLLGPVAPTDGDLLGVRLGRGTERRPGRGALVQRGAWTAVQVALPSSTVDPPAPGTPGTRQPDGEPR